MNNRKLITDEELKEITDKEAFKGFVRVQKSVICNMLDRTTVCSRGKITPEQHKDIIKNYDKYAKRWPDVVEGI